MFRLCWGRWLTRCVQCVSSICDAHLHEAMRDLTACGSLMFSSQLTKSTAGAVLGRVHKVFGRAARPHARLRAHRALPPRTARGRHVRHRIHPLPGHALFRAEKSCRLWLCASRSAERWVESDARPDWPQVAAAGGAASRPVGHGGARQEWVRLGDGLEGTRSMAELVARSVGDGVGL
eukprot:SAG25_NODE_31_length_20541_cov_59.033069_18_plen_178_part_00